MFLNIFGLSKDALHCILNAVFKIVPRHIKSFNNKYFCICVFRLKIFEILIFIANMPMLILSQFFVDATTQVKCR